MKFLRRRKSSTVIALVALAFFIVHASRFAQAQFSAQSVIDITTCQTISSAGSYRLANNISGGTGNGQSCINIQASNVTIDGNGKTITPSGEYAIMDLADGTISNNISISNFTSSAGVEF